MQYSILLLLLIYFSQISEGQNTFNNRFHFGFPAAVLCGVIPTDSCYYASGIIADSVFPYNTGNVFTKLDLNGIPVSTKTIRSPVKTYETWFDDLMALPDGGFATSGYSFDTVLKTILIRYDNNGDTLFTKEFNNPFYPQFSEIQPWGGSACTPDNGFIISNIIKTSNLPNVDIYLIKTDSLGNKLWSKKYGDTGWDRPQSLLVTPEGKIIVGAIRTNDNTATENYTYQCHIFQTDNEGNKEWDYFSPVSLGLRDAANDMVLLEDGSIVIASAAGYEQVQASVNDVYFEKLAFRLNPEKEIEWSISFPEIELSGIAETTNIISVSDNSGFVMAGTAGIDLPGNNTYSIKGWIGKISHSGIKIWEREYVGIDNDNNSHQIFDLKETPDGGFILCGQSLDWTADTIPQQAWLLKLDKHGCLVPGCHIVGAANEKQPETNLVIYPNPTTDYLNFYLRTPKTLKSADFRIVSAEGKVIKTFSSDNPDATFILPVWDWAAGVYFLQYLEEGVVRGSEQFIKQ
jgi:hypothetical protein